MTATATLLRADPAALGEFWDAMARPNDVYEVRVTEELHEVSYLDQVRLFQVEDVPVIREWTGRD